MVKLKISTRLTELKIITHQIIFKIYLIFYYRNKNNFLIWSYTHCFSASGKRKKPQLKRKSSERRQSKQCVSSTKNSSSVPANTTVTPPADNSRRPSQEPQKTSGAVNVVATTAVKPSQASFGQGSGMTTQLQDTGKGNVVTDGVRERLFHADQRLDSEGNNRVDGNVDSAVISCGSNIDAINAQVADKNVKHKLLEQSVKKSKVDKNLLVQESQGGVSVVKAIEDNNKASSVITTKAVIEIIHETDDKLWDCVEQDGNENKQQMSQRPDIEQTSYDMPVISGDREKHIAMMSEEEKANVTNINTNIFKDIISEEVENISFSESLVDLQSVTDRKCLNNSENNANTSKKPTHRACQLGAETNVVEQKKNHQGNGSLNRGTDLDLEDFGESFALNTQELQDLNMVDNNVRKQLERQTPNSHVKTSHQPIVSPNSEALFSEKIDDFSPQPEYNVESKAIEMNVIRNEILTESSQDDLEVNISHDALDLNVSHNALDQNISHNSNEDMFNDSAGLVAASCYERVVLEENSQLNASDLGNSFHDLHIPYQSGQEQLFERNDAEIVKPQTSKVNTSAKNDPKPVVSEIFTPCNVFARKSLDNNCKTLGQFSSPKPADKIEKGLLHCDLAEALEMGESFSSTFQMSMPTDNKSEKGCVWRCYCFK